MPEQKIFRIQLLAVVAGTLLLAAKFAAYFLTHSNTILSDALESIINVAAGAFALYSLYLASKPKDADHPYGHGKVEFISAGFEGILIIIAGVLIVGKAVVGFFHPQPLQNLNTGLYIVVASGIVNYMLGYLLERYGVKHRSLVLIADGKHLKSDAYSSLGILAGVGLILLTGWQPLDNVVAILMGLLILLTGVRLVRKGIAGIMDEADSEIIHQLVELLKQHRKAEWIDVHNLRVIQYGNKLHIDCHVTLPWYWSLQQAHDEMEEIARLVNEKHASQLEFFIHADPCIAASCKICSLQNCTERKESFTGLIDWTLENIQRNKKHGLP